MRTVLIVDDDPDIRDLVQLVLAQSPLQIDVVAEAADGSAAIAEWRRMDPPPVPGVVVLDNFMPDKTGLDVAREILRELPDQPIILFSAYLDDSVRAEATRLGVARCVDKADVARLPELIAELCPEPTR